MRKINKNHIIIFNILLLIWFSLDMIGFKIGGKELVSQAWKEDGIFFIIYSLSFFILNTITGIKVLITVLSIWLITQFLSHELYTIVGGGEGKIRFF